MVKGIYDAAKSMQDKMKNIQIVANNLANMNSIGYKREIPFTEYYDRAKNISQKSLTDFTEGSLLETGNTLDLAITGKGFFVVNTERGLEFTKNGKFILSEDGYLVNKDGYRIQGEGGSINILETLITEKDQLKVSADGNIKIGDILVDKLKIVKIEDTSALVRTEGQNFKVDAEYVFNADEMGYKIHQGYLEESNTNALLEMQEMIKLNMDYEASQKMIKALDSTMAKSKEIGKV